MNRFAAPDQNVKHHEAQVRATYGQFLLLEAARQLTIDGKAEPILAPVLEISEPLTLSSSEQSDFLKPVPGQGVLPLPMPTIHAMVDGKPNADCMRHKDGRSRGFMAKAECAHRPGDVIILPCLCKGLNCESSRASNESTRAKLARQGTARKGISIGFDAFGDAPLGIVITTIPSELRERCVGEDLLRFRGASNQLVRELVDRMGANGAPFFQRSWFHPVGEPAMPSELDETINLDGKEYKPHENVLFPLAVLRYGKVRRLKAFVPPEWLGAGNWLCVRWRELLVEVFGQWWPESEPAPTVNVFYEYRQTAEEKAHAARYFARPFPGWHGGELKGVVNMRPKALGLAHWKHKAELLELVTKLTPGGLEAVKNPPCRHCEQSHKALCVHGQDAERLLYTMHRLMAELRGESLYVQQWRIMTAGQRSELPIPPSQGPPVLMLSADDQFQALQACSVH